MDWMIVVSYAINEAKSYENGYRLDKMDEVRMDYALEFSHFVNRSISNFNVCFDLKWNEK